MISLKKLTNLILFVSLLGVRPSFAMSDDESDPDQGRVSITYSFQKEEKSWASLVKDSKRIEDLQHILYPNSSRISDFVELMPTPFHKPWPPKPPKLPFENPDFYSEPFNIAGGGGTGGSGDDDREKLLPFLKYLPFLKQFSIAGSGGAGGDDNEGITPFKTWADLKFNLKPFNIAGSGGAGGDDDVSFLLTKSRILLDSFKIELDPLTADNKKENFPSLPGDLVVLSGHPFFLILSHLPTQDYAQLGLVSKTLHNFTHQKLVAMAHLESLTLNPSLLGIRTREMEERFEKLDVSQPIPSRAEKLARETFEKDFKADINTLYSAIRFYQEVIGNNGDGFRYLCTYLLDKEPLGKLNWICTLSEIGPFPMFTKHVQALAPKLEKEKISQFRSSLWRLLTPLELPDFAQLNLEGLQNFAPLNLIIVDQDNQFLPLEEDEEDQNSEDELQ